MVAQRYGDKILARTNQVKKALVVVEPEKEFSSGILRKLNQCRIFLEVKLWGSPLLKKLAKNYDVAITPRGGAFDKSLVNNGKVRLVERNTLESSAEYRPISKLMTKRVHEIGG